MEQNKRKDLKKVYRGIYLNAGPTCLSRLDRNHVPAHRASSRKLFSYHSLKGTLFQTSVWNPSRFEVYTDGSKRDSEAGFAVCILEHGEPYGIFKFKLGVNDTVFQAELEATDFAVRWDWKKISKLILLRIASHPSRPSGAPGPGLRWSSGPKKILT
ncbi:hypothetical protein AVEN_205219-1 [Araneus ventricosus]|uniref:RNase H type-1 domain-containing protein n=1 Tax=Araneus ventricosus TaxID=182803 RepID=A0A4Y2JS89_ARAVE|nr:hypothetical protein AVEN_205219-1 [Araneus ventricosus]